MSAADIIIVVLVILAVAAVISVACLRKNKSPCSHCPYKKDCDKHCTSDKRKGRGVGAEILTDTDTANDDEVAPQDIELVPGDATASSKAQEVGVRGKHND